MEASMSGNVSLGKLSSSRLSFVTTGTDMSNIPTSCTNRETSREGKSSACEMHWF